MRASEEGQKIRAGINRFRFLYPLLSFADCRLHSSNKQPANIIDSKQLNTDESKVDNSELFAKDLVRIHEFSRQFRSEILKILSN